MNGRQPEHPIVIFDGSCHVCDASVQFILDRDEVGLFHFASRQSEAGRRLLRAHGLPEEGVGSLVVLEGARVHVRSSAVLAIVRRLPGAWPLLGAFRAVPRPLRDAAYDLFARHRARFLPHREACAIPTPERAARFLTS